VYLLIFTIFSPCPPTTLLSSPLWPCLLSPIFHYFLLYSPNLLLDPVFGGTKDLLPPYKILITHFQVHHHHLTGVFPDPIAFRYSEWSLLLSYYITWTLFSLGIMTLSFKLKAGPIMKSKYGA
jgi:hypothetical protein